jgi:pimeloyl-ACP methyl ester carboxylesterase
MAGILPSNPVSAQIYVWAGEAAGTPGTIIRKETKPRAPQEAQAYGVLYRSTDPAGKPIGVSGVIIVPKGPVPPGGRPIVAWAHGTTGVVSDCAPSLLTDFYPTVPGLNDFLAKGFIVAATDYPGLGPPGPSPYLIGESEGRAVLDSVRAAQYLPDANASNQFAVWGHSQGGHSSLFTGQLAKSYAPELSLVGVAVAAPATHLQKLLRDDLPRPVGRVLSAMALYAWSTIYGIPASSIVESSAMAAFEDIANDCISVVPDLPEIFKMQSSLRDTYLKADPTTTPPWSTLMIKNSPDPTVSPGAPVFLAQGTADMVVEPSVTEAYYRELCKSGAIVRFMEVQGATHDKIDDFATPDVVSWIADRFAGKPVPTTCRP